MLLPSWSAYRCIFEVYTPYPMKAILLTPERVALRRRHPPSPA